MTTDQFHEVARGGSWDIWSSYLSRVWVVGLLFLALLCCTALGLVLSLKQDQSTLCIFIFILSFVFFVFLVTMAPDIEKNHASESIRSDSQDEHESQDNNAQPKSRYERWTKHISGLETRGIEPVSLSERQKPTPWSLLEMLLMWFSMGMVVNNIIVGTLGTLVMKLGYKDAAICAICGNVFGNVALGYMSTFGPRSGHRTLVCRNPVLVPCICLLDN